MANQPITGYPSSYRAPFTAVEINFGQGPSTAEGAVRSTIYLGPKTSAGSGTAGTVYRITREQDAIDVAGVGSFLHRMCRFHLMVDKNAKLYAMPYAASSGSGVATATGTITVTMTSGSNPTATGKLTATVCGEEFTVSFKTSDTVTTIGDALAAQINNRQFLPLTAGNSGGVVTLTAKHAGASSGDGTVGVLRMRASVEAGKNVVVATSGAALGLGTGTAGADGATTETANLTTALAGITSSLYYYLGFSVWTSTAIAPVKTHIVNKSGPNPGLRSAAWTAYTGTQSALTTIVNSANYERRSFVWQENSEHVGFRSTDGNDHRARDGGLSGAGSFPDDALERFEELIFAVELEIEVRERDLQNSVDQTTELQAVAEFGSGHSMSSVRQRVTLTACNYY